MNTDSAPSVFSANSAWPCPWIASLKEVRRNVRNGPRSSGWVVLTLVDSCEMWVIPASSYTGCAPITASEHDGPTTATTCWFASSCAADAPPPSVHPSFASTNSTGCPWIVMSSPASSAASARARPVEARSPSSIVLTPIVIGSPPAIWTVWKLGSASLLLHATSAPRSAMASTGRSGRAASTVGLLRASEAGIIAPSNAVENLGGSKRGRFRGFVVPPVYDRAVGSIIDLSQWRERRERDPMTRLERAIARLEGLLRRGSGRLSGRVEAELLAITGAVTAGLEDEAAERAERLAERLEHPSARLSS